VGGKDSNPKITTGPVNKIAMSVYDSTQDPFAQGLAIFDMTALAWADKYTANAPIMSSQMRSRNSTHSRSSKRVSAIEYSKDY